MKLHIGHIGAPGNLDVRFTISQQQSIDQTIGGLIARLPSAAPELDWFRSLAARRVFPTGRFNCWGVPEGGRRWFRQLGVGDATLIMPTGGTHGEIEFLGIVKAICPVDAWHTSKLLWPETPYRKSYPLLFFFDTEAGSRRFSDFLDDVGWSQNLDLHGLFRAVAAVRLARWDGAEGYVDFLRERCGFHRLFSD